MQKRGFTLIELLVVIVIIGLLTAVATTAFLTAQRNTRDNSRKTAVQSIANALEAYKLINQTYPGQLNATTDTANCSGNTNIVGGITYSAYYDSPSAAAGCTPIGSVSFAPAPNWIPGLSQYINPAPVEPRYVGKDGTITAGGQFDSKGAPNGASNSTRTFSYQKTATGYYVNTKLEGDGSIYTVSK